MGQTQTARGTVNPSDAELIAGVRWFISLRWAAGAGVLIVPIIGRAVFRIDVALALFFCVAAAIFLCNAIFLFVYARLERRPERRLAACTRFAHAQICVDWIALTLLVHLSGGVESPILPFFLFHVIIAALLLSRTACFAHAALASALAAAVAWGEAVGLVPHLSYPAIVPETAYDHMPYVIIKLSFLSAALFGSAFLATSIAARLRERDAELIRLKDDLERSYHNLENVDRAKTEFTYKVTHELRAPLGAVQSLLGLILEGYVADPAKMREYVVRVQARVQALLQLVTDLLDLARGKMSVSDEHLSCIDLPALVERIRELYRQKLQAGRIAFVFEKPRERVSVEMRLSDCERILTNLIDNAVKYTDQGGTVAVDVAMRGGDVSVSVADTGIGIPKGDIDKVFSEFFRADNARKRVAGGSGLGLSIVKQLVSRYNGVLSVQSELNKGTHITIVFPKGYTI